MDLYLLKFPYRKVLAPVAERLAFVHPDILSHAATLITVGTGACYYYALRDPRLLLAAIVLTVARMTLNTLDGVIAIRRGNLSLKGEIVNALPDRYSDIIHVAALALSPLCDPVIGMFGLASMLLVSYTGMLGKALGVEWQHHGPLGKVERLVLLMVATLWQFLLLNDGARDSSLGGLPVTPMEWCMFAFIALGQVTVLRRLKGMVRQITRLEWHAKGEAANVPGAVVVIYDSRTGNTEKVARAIAQPLDADVRHVSEVADVYAYDLVVIGTPNIRANPSPAIRSFIEQNPAIEDYATFVTYGAPVWGPISARRCFAALRTALGGRPWGEFSCKGYHASFKTYGGHPTDDELLSAHLFGIRLAKHMRTRVAA